MALAGLIAFLLQCWILNSVLRIYSQLKNTESDLHRSLESRMPSVLRFTKKGLPFVIVVFALQAIGALATTIIAIINWRA